MYHMVHRRMLTEHRVRPEFMPPPGLTVNDPPEIHKFGAARFEDLGRSLLEHEPGIETCEQYGVPGETQYGIDLLGHHRAGGSATVGQCKCCRVFKAANIKAAVDDFLDYWDTWWKKRGIKRFILMVACDLKERASQEQIRTEKVRLKGLGVLFDVWSRGTLISRLAPWPEIVVAHFSPAAYWIEQITGRQPMPFRMPASDGTTTTSALADSDLAELISRASEGVAHRLELIRGMVRRGAVGEAAGALELIRGDQAVWDRLPDDVKVKTLRLQATFALDGTGDLVSAKRFAAEASRIDRELQPAVEALIVLKQDGPEAALEFIGDDSDGTQELARIRALCLLHLKRSGDAASVLRKIAEDLEPETHRLLALCLLAEAQVDEAERNAKIAATRMPDSWIARMTLGIVLYARALSPAVTPSFGPWPSPTSWALVRRDDASIGRLREAHAAFEGLLTSGQERASRQDIEGWLLACMANDADRRVEAEAFADKVIAVDRTHPSAIAWALARALPFNEDASRKALENLLDAGRGHPFHVVALVGIHMKAGKVAKAAAALKKYKKVFNEAETPGLLAFLQGQIAIRQFGGTHPETGATGPDLSLSVMRAVNDPDQSGGNKALVDLAARCLMLKEHSSTLLECLSSLAQRLQWESVVPYADALLERIGTADAVSLAAQATAMTGAYGRSMEILQHCRGAFPGSNLPRDLRRLRIDCLRRLGRPLEAIAEAEDLARDPQARQDAVMAAELHLQHGSPRKASNIIRKLRREGTLPPRAAVRFARGLSREDPVLARELLLELPINDLDPAMVPVAFMTSRLLGLGSEAKPIVARLQAVATAGEPSAPVIAVTLDQVREFAVEHNRANAWLDKQLVQGTMPLHMLAPRLGASLAEMFRSMPELRERDVGAPGYLPARYGGRELPPDSAYPPEPAGLRLHMDLTALLLAGHLGILDKIELLFTPVRISSMLAMAIAEMLEAAAQETTTLKEDERLLGLVASGRAEEVSFSDADDRLTDARATPDRAHRFGEQALGTGGAVVTWHPPDETIAPDAAARFANLSGIVEDLRAEGVLSVEEAASALKELGTAGNETPVTASLARGAPIYFRDSTASQLLSSGTLEKACSHHRILVDGHHLAAVRERTGRANRAAQLIEWLERLRTRLADGLQNGIYKCVPLAPAIADHEPESAAEQCLLDLFTMPRTQGDVVWADDRFLQGAPWSNQVTVLGTPEILQALRIYGHLDLDGFFEAVYRLRASRVNYLAPVDGELKRLLARALHPVLGIVESPELAALRRYLAVCVLNEGLLQRPGTMTESGTALPGELSFILGWSRTAREATCSGWLDPNLTEEQRIARADWILTNLDVHSYQTLPVMPSEDGHVNLLAMHLAALMGQGFHIALRTDPNWRKKCQGYFAWLDDRVLQPRFKADPGLATIVSPLLRAMLLANHEEGERTDEFRLFEAHVLRRFVFTVPEPVLSLLLDGETELWERMGVSPPGPGLAIGRYGFSDTAFWPAAERAVAGEVVAVQTVAGASATVTARRSTQDDRPILCVSVEGAPQMEVDDARNGLLETDFDARRRVMRDNRAWFDMPEPAASAMIESIASNPDPASRLSGASKAQDDSMAELYERFEARLGSGEEVRISQSQPPSVASLTRHLRLLPGNDGFAARLDRAAVSLVEQEGLDEAFRRLSGIPVHVPEALLTALGALSRDEASATVLRWAGMPSPIARLHVLRAAIHIRDLHGAVDIDPILDPLLAESEEDGGVDAFLTVLEAAASWLTDWPGADGCPTADRLALAWTHAHRLFTAMISAGCSYADIAETFSKQGSSGITHYLVSGWAHRDDAAHPLLVNRRRLLLRGLDYAFGSTSAALLGSNRLAKVRSLAAYLSSETELPVLDLLRDPHLGTDALGSFLAGELTSPLLDAFGPEISNFYRGASIQQFSEEIVGQLGTGEGNPVQWLYVHAVVGICLPHPGVSSRLTNAVRATPVSLLCRKDLAAGMAAIHTVAIQAGRSGDRDLIGLVAQDFELILADLRGLVPGQRPMSREHRQALATIFTGYVHLSQGDTAATRVRHFCELVRETMVREPGFYIQMRTALSRMCNELPFDAARELWPLLIAARATG